MRLVYPHLTDEPNMVLIEAVKDGNSRISVEKPLIVYEADGRYTSEILEIYKLPAYGSGREATEDGSVETGQAELKKEY